MAPGARVQETLSVSHHQLLLLEDRSEPDPPAGAPNNGLATVAPWGVAIWTGIHTGLLDLTIEALHEPPGTLDEAWDEILEVSVTPARPLHVATVMMGAPSTFPAIGGGGLPYRLRIHAGGRDTDVDGTAFEATERYLIQAWRAAVAPDHVHKQVEGGYGAQLRQRAGPS